MNHILLNQNKFEINEASLPMIIHGEEGSGASLLTITVAANLFAQGFKLLFLTGYHMAQEEFMKQVASFDRANDDVVFCFKDDVEQFANYIHTLPDINERIIVVKNADLFDEKVFDLILTKRNVVISGDINRCVSKENILIKNFETKITFSEFNGMQIPELKKYQSFLVGSGTSGFVTTHIHD
jgi:hypothetical protein